MLGVEQKEGKMRITLKTIFGLEEVLADELKELGFAQVELLNRAVRIEGTWRDVYFLNLHVRCANSVLVEVKKFTIRNEEDLYERCMKIKWTSYFTVDKSFAVKGAVFSELFRHTQYPFLVVKDAIADSFRKEFDERPNVNVKAPQVMFDVHIHDKDVTISLNTSGLSLFQRGYREAVGLAPLNEVVAAGLIRMSGWDKKSTFIDPFCGSGTILIEAALMAAGLPPQFERTHFAFKNFKNFQPEIWEEILDAVPKRVTELPCRIIGSDMSADMITKARRNFRGLPVGRFIETSVNSFQELKQIEGPGVMISNPPYGERMGENIEELYTELGDWMKNSMKGFDCWVLSSNTDAMKFIGLRPDRKIKVFNGDLECSFRKFGIYEGSKKGKYMNADAGSNDVEEDPQEEFQGKENEDSTWVKSISRAKSGDKREFDKKPIEKKKSFDKKSFDKPSFERKPFEKKPLEKKPIEQKTLIVKIEQESPIVPLHELIDEVKAAPAVSKYGKKPVDEVVKPIKAKPVAKAKKADVEVKPAASSYTKEPIVSEKDKNRDIDTDEVPKQVAKSEPTDKPAITRETYKNRSAIDKYGRKD